MWWASLVAQLVKNLSAVWEIWVQSLGWEDTLEKGTFGYTCLSELQFSQGVCPRVWFLGHMVVLWASVVAQLVENPCAVWENPVQILGWEDPLENR